MVVISFRLGKLQQQKMCKQTKKRVILKILLSYFVIFLLPKVATTKKTYKKLPLGIRAKAVGRVLVDMQASILQGQ